jgi:hypothetical protein
MAMSVEEQLAEAKRLLTLLIAHGLGSPSGYFPTVGYPITREVQKSMYDNLGIKEIVYQPRNALFKEPQPTWVPPEQDSAHSLYKGEREPGWWERND